MRKVAQWAFESPYPTMNIDLGVLMRRCYEWCKVRCIWRWRRWVNRSKGRRPVKVTSEESKLYEKLDFVINPDYVSHDLFDRTSEEEKQDIAFLEAWVDAKVYNGELKILPDLHYNTSKERQIISKGGALSTEKFAVGLYDSKFENIVEWPPLLYSLQQDATPRVFLTPEGAIQPINGLVHVQDSKSTRYGGFALKPNPETGRYDIDRPMTTEEFKKLYPLCAAHGLSECTGYATALYSKETADLYDKAPEVLENLRGMLKLFPNAELHWVVPMWIRTYGWGIPNGYKLPPNCGATRGISTPYKTQLLLNDKLVWRAHLSIDGTPIPGVAFFTDDGKLVISDWCFREEEMNNEMFHGNANKHNILTWVAGPCADRWAKNEQHKVIAVGKMVDKKLMTQWDLLMKLLDTALPVNNPEEVVAALDKGYNGMMYTIAGQPHWLYKITKAWKHAGALFVELDRIGGKGAIVRGQDVTKEGPWSGITIPLPSVIFPNWVTQLALLETK